MFSLQPAGTVRAEAANPEGPDPPDLSMSNIENVEIRLPNLMPRLSGNSYCALTQVPGPAHTFGIIAAPDDGS